ncbi:hypothetical protein F511_41378 [Dorcoceras hygrometricum]|uniref:Endoglucanase n=1 Tax=Dorcoceras hygrometricum TaxID=472368 RepID=A0A2Z7C8I9_9LAMI|nr:hypothetical protein F511_41378 [Dorcoceras hygrometricum]
MPYSSSTFNIIMHVRCFTLYMLILSCSAFTSQDYSEALEKSILFFEGQRSGRLPPNQRLRWRGDSGLSDGSTNNVNLEGGYYDAGDNVKFGLPMAFTTTLLAWSVIEFGYSMQNQLDNAKEALRWGTDYLLKAATCTPSTLYVQVGDPNMDHRCWERPEDMDTPRNVYKVSPRNPGSDVAAETAAALAAASIVFKDSDPPYSKKLLNTAMKVFDLADRYKGAYSDSLGSVVCPFYCSYSGYHGFLELNIQEFQQYKVHSDIYICSLIPGSPNFQAQYTPGGLFYKGSESNLQYVTTSSFLILTYAKYLNSNGEAISCGSSTITSESLVALAKKQVDYILGENPSKMSYMVGFGQRYPLRIHHRGSSLPSVHDHSARIRCGDGFQYLYASSPNPNVLVGAIIGGPDNRDNFSNDRNNYQQSEPATYINAPFVGVLAFFSQE